jgi:hypothetical protein
MDLQREYYLISGDGAKALVLFSIFIVAKVVTTAICLIATDLTVHADKKIVKRTADLGKAQVVV